MSAGANRRATNKSAPGFLRLLTRGALHWVCQFSLSLFIQNLTTIRGIGKSTAAAMFIDYADHPILNRSFSDGDHAPCYSGFA